MIRGAFFRRFASSKHTGDAASPISIRGGRSSTTSRETEYFSSIWRARASRRRLVSVRYTVPRRRRGVSIRVEEEAGQKMGRDERDRGTPSPGVFVRVARKGLTGGIFLQKRGFLVRVVGKGLSREIPKMETRNWKTRGE